MRKKDVEPAFLTKEKIQIIADKKIKIERLSRVRDVYILCRFTGLAHADIEKLKRIEISVGVLKGS